MIIFYYTYYFIIVMSSSIIITNSMNQSMRKLSRREQMDKTTSLENRNMRNLFDKALYKKQRNTDKKCNNTSRRNMGLRMKNQQE